MGPDDQAHFLGVLKDAPNLKRIGFIDIININTDILMSFAMAAAQKDRRRLLFHPETPVNIFLSALQTVFDGSLWKELCVPLDAITYLNGSVAEWMAVGWVTFPEHTQSLTALCHDERIRLISVSVAYRRFDNVPHFAMPMKAMKQRTVHVTFASTNVNIQNFGMLFACYHRALVMFQRCRMFKSPLVHQQNLTTSDCSTVYAEVANILHAIYHRVLWREPGSPDESQPVYSIIEIGAETILNEDGNLNIEPAIVVNLRCFVQTLVKTNFTIPPDNLHVMLDLGYRSWAGWGRQWDSAADAIGRMQTHRMMTHLRNLVIQNDMWIRWCEHNLHVLWPQPMAAAEVAARSQFLGMSSVWPFASVFDT